MARNVQFQPLRGVQANLQGAMPLALGEMYFATDTGNLFLGTPGYGLGYVQIGDATALNEELERFRVEIRAIKAALLDLGLDTQEFAGISEQEM